MSCCCNTCYKLTPASTGVEAIYKTTIEDGVRFWYGEGGDVITDATLIAELEALATDADKIDCVAYTEQIVLDTEFETEVFCEFDTATDEKTGVKVLVVVAIDEAGQPASNQYLLDTGAVYTPAAGTELRLCEDDTDTDLEPKEMCDNEATTFLRWFQSKDGILTGSTVDTDLEGAPYTPTGPVGYGKCNEETCYLTDVYKVSSAAGGLVNVQSWYDPAVNTGANGAPNDTPDAIFSGPVDALGFPTHINGAPDATYTITDFDFSDNNDAPTGFDGTATDQHMIWAYVSVPEPVDIYEDGPNVEAGKVWLAECCGDLRPIGSWTNAEPQGGGYVGSVPAGFHLIGVQMTDPSAFSRIRLNYSTDGGATITPLPSAWLHGSKPKIECLKAEVCPKSGDVTLLDGTAITVDNAEYFYCPPECQPVFVAPSTKYELTEACFRDPSSAANVTVYGYKKLAINIETGEVESITYLDADGTTELDQNVFIQTKCC